MSDRWDKTVTVTQSAYCVCGTRLHPDEFPNEQRTTVCSQACYERYVALYTPLYTPLRSPRRRALSNLNVQQAQDAVLAAREAQR